MFKKTCFECGAKIEDVYEGMCQSCYKEKNPPIKEIKPINIKYCNSCKRLFYNNQMYYPEEIENKIEEIVAKNLILDEKYELKKLTVENFIIEKATVNFDVEIDCDLKK